MVLEIAEQYLTEFFTSLFKTILFFLEDTHQSFTVTILHYTVFIVGFIYFFFFSKPGDTFRIVFFIFIVTATLSYYCFNKCLAGVVEYNLSNKKNVVQLFMDKCFGEDCNGNMYSKGFLTFFSIVIGSILYYDYNIQ